MPSGDMPYFRIFAKDGKKYNHNFGRIGGFYVWAAGSIGNKEKVLKDICKRLDVKAKISQLHRG